MITTELYDGQGLGNQLWSYVVARVISIDNNFAFGIQNPEKFKGRCFLNLDMGSHVVGGFGPPGGPPVELPMGIKHYYSERAIRHPRNDVDIRTHDAALTEICDNTKIEGIFQSEKYILHRKAEIREWLRYRPQELDFNFADDDICVINFRGGEYKRNPTVFLRRQYWIDAIARVRQEVPKVRFVVVTDDPSTARKYFPTFPIRHYGVAGDYQAINQAPYLILSNSSFAFFPAWLSENVRLCLAPKFWASHNYSDGYWGCSYNIVNGWTYLDRRGALFNYEDCVREHESYQESHREIYQQKTINNATVVVSSFNNDLSWLPRFAHDYVVYEQGAGSGIPASVLREKVRFVSNSGSNLRDYFTYIIENYDNLPNTIFLVKGNIFPRHVRQHVFQSYASKAAPCSIVDRKKHKSNFPIAFFGRTGRYYELNTNWYMNQNVPHKYFARIGDLLNHFDPTLKPGFYLKFSIGAQYIVTRQQIQNIPRGVYLELRRVVSHDEQATGYTAECFMVERVLERLWKHEWSHPTMWRPVRDLEALTTVKWKRSISHKLMLSTMDVAARVIRQLQDLVLLQAQFISNRSKLILNFWSVFQYRSDRT